MEERNILARKLLSDFIDDIKPFLESLGKFNEDVNEITIVQEFSSQFYANLISLENSLNLRDTLAVTLIQRYNHEMLRDFFYIFSSDSILEKAKEFYSYKDRISINPTLREWKKTSFNNKIIPPWISDEKTTKIIYKHLSDLAHPNMLSMRLHRGTERSQNIVIENAISLIINDIVACFSYKPFRDLAFGKNYNTTDFFTKMNEFHIRAFSILDM